MKAHLLLFSVLPASAWALNLALPPGASSTADEAKDYASYHLPVGPFQDGQIPTIWTEGQMTTRAWQIPAEGQTTLQILAPLRDQLIAEGFEPVFECAANDCGGYDFRFGTEVLDPPAMFVDLGDYHFFAGQKPGETIPEYVSLLVSQGGPLAYAQLIRVGPADGRATQITTSTKAPALDGTPMGETLVTSGHAVLDDLTFATGSSDLADQRFASLEALAVFLRADPDRKVVLVGHTDAEGSLEGNIALSKRRATSVANRLVSAYGVAQGQVSAEGVGYLSPRASNQTDQGKTLNRRVEVVLAQ